MATRDDIRVQILSEPRLLVSVRRLICGYVESQGFSTDRAEEVMLAVDEACSNSIRHAYQGRPDGVIELILRSDNGHVEVVLRDEGEPADLDRIREKQAHVSTAADLLVPGGLGLQLMQTVFDEVEFGVGEPVGNCVTMRLRREEDGSKNAK